MLTFYFVQIFFGLCAFLGLGQAIAKEAKPIDKVIGIAMCIFFLALMLFVEVNFR